MEKALCNKKSDHQEINDAVLSIRKVIKSNLEHGIDIKEEKETKTKIKEIGGYNNSLFRLSNNLSDEILLLTDLAPSQPNKKYTVQDNLQTFNQESANHSTFNLLENNLDQKNSTSAKMSGYTTDEITRELLKPMLKEWLDTNLPSVIESLVNKDIARTKK